MNGNRSFEAEAQKEIVLARLDHEAKEKKLDAILSQAGPTHDFSKVTTIDGTPREKMHILRKLLKDLAVLEETIERNSDELRGRKGKTTMAKTSSRDYTDSLYGIMPDDRKGGGGRDDRFENLGDFCIKAITDPAGLKAMGIDTGEGGGFAIPDQWASKIMAVTPQDAIVQPRAMVLPVGTPPDAKLNIPALRQGASGMLAGVNFTAAQEGTQGAADDPKLDMITLEPQRVSGYFTVGNSLLRNSAQMSAFIETIFRNSKNAWCDYQFIQGPGLGYPLGLLNSPGAVKVPRATASTIHFADVANMLSKQVSSNAIWICSQSGMGQIMTICDANGNAMWIPAAFGGVQGPLPDRLAGKEIFFTYRSPVLGSQGDLMLVDPSMYLVLFGSGPYIQASEHVLFRESQTIIKMEFWIDAQGWVKTPILAEDGTTAVSPYVILQ
ncbi:MAG: phage major capsid protein [Spirochaetia bacterium]|jgi:HK97 family phage major capsid protein